MKVTLIILVCFLSGCITAPDGKKGIGVQMPLQYKETDLGSLVIGWIPPDSVTDGRYGTLIRDGKNYIRSF